MKVIRYTQPMVDEFVRDGYWTDENFYDFYERNAREIGAKEALVDSTYRVTWTWLLEGKPGTASAAFTTE